MKILDTTITIYDLCFLAIPAVFFILFIATLIRQRSVDKKFKEAMDVLDKPSNSPDIKNEDN